MLPASCHSATPPPAPNPQQQQQQQQHNDSSSKKREKEIRCVLNALRTYAFVCLTDAIFLMAMAALPKSTFRLVGTRCVHSGHTCCIIFVKFFPLSILRELLSVWLAMGSTALNFGPIRTVVKGCLSSDSNQVHPQQQQ